MENSMDPGQLASQYPAELDMHCFQNGLMVWTTATCTILMKVLYSAETDHTAVQDQTT